MSEKKNIQLFQETVSAKIVLFLPLKLQCLHITRLYIYSLEHYILSLSYKFVMINIIMWHYLMVNNYITADEY